jgi:pimeloyl-ACP methyl ester carboxylesterase
VPYFIWDPTFEALIKAGFWTLRYDLYGRGYSDRPNEDYDIDLFERQLSDLLDVLGFKEKVNVVGLSMGGIILAAFAIRHPKRVAKLGLVDPAGLPLHRALTFKLLTVRGLGEVMLNFVGVHNLENSIASDFYEPKNIEEFMELYGPQMEYKGFRRAILSTIREGVLDRSLKIYEGVGMSDLPVLLVWGVEDNTVPFRHSAALVEAIPQVDFHPIEEAGHIPHYEKPEVVNPILIEFLRR